MQFRREGQSTGKNCDVLHVRLGSGVGRVNADNLSALDALSARKSYELGLL
jgi:hypothetical protein